MNQVFIHLPGKSVLKDIHYQLNSIQDGFFTQQATYSDV